MWKKMTINKKIVSPSSVPTSLKYADFTSGSRSTLYIRHNWMCGGPNYMTLLIYLFNSFIYLICVFPYSDRVLLGTWLSYTSGAFSFGLFGWPWSMKHFLSDFVFFFLLFSFHVRLEICIHSPWKPPQRHSPHAQILYADVPPVLGSPELLLEQILRSSDNRVSQVPTGILPL